MTIIEMTKEGITQALLSAEGYKGYRLELDESDNEYYVKIYSRQWGWDFYSEHGICKTYKRLNRAVSGVQAIINKYTF